MNSKCGDEEHKPTVKKVNSTASQSLDAMPSSSGEDDRAADFPVDRGYAWLVLFAVFCIHILWGCVVRSMGIIATELVDLYATTNGQASLVVSGLFGVFLISSPLAAYLCRNFSLRVIIAAGGILCCLGFSSVSVFNDFMTTTVILGSMTGFGMALFHCAAVAILADYFHRYRGIAMCMLFSGCASGAFLGPYILHLWCYQYGTKGGMLMFGGMMLHVCVFGCLMLPKSYFLSSSPSLVTPPSVDNRCNVDKKQKNDADSDLRSDSIDTKTPLTLPLPLSHNPPCSPCHTWATLDHIFNLELLRMPDFWLISPAVALFSMSSPTFFFLIANYGRDLLLSPNQVTVVLIVQGAADIVCRASMGFVADLRCVNRPLLATVFLFCHALVWLVCTQIRTFPGLLCVSVGQALFGGSNYGIVAAVLSEVVSLRHVPTAYAYCLFLEGVLNFIVPQITGALRDFMGDWTASFWIFCCVNSTAGLIFLALLFRLRQKKRNCPPEVEEIQVDFA